MDKQQIQAGIHKINEDGYKNTAEEAMQKSNHQKGQGTGPSLQLCSAHKDYYEEGWRSLCRDYSNGVNFPLRAWQRPNQNTRYFAQNLFYIQEYNKIFQFNGQNLSQSNKFCRIFEYLTKESDGE